MAYSWDRRVQILTCSIAGAVALAVVVLWAVSPGLYLPVWLAGVAMAAGMLAVLSVPRAVVVTEDGVEIRCVLEITHLAWHQIRSVRRMADAERRKFFPLFASAGFFGFFGYWLDTQSWDLVKFYTTSREGLIEIEDIYEQRYVINSAEADHLVEILKSGIES